MRRYASFDVAAEAVRWQHHAMRPTMSRKDPMATLAGATDAEVAETEPKRPGGFGAAVKQRLTDPLVLFLLAGGAIFAAHALATSGDPVVYTADIEKALVADHEALTGRTATAADKTRLMADHVADELLFREAVARGEHLTDSVVRKRLIDKMRFAVTGPPPEPAEAEMVNFYAENIGLYRSEPRTSFEHVFFSEKPAAPAARLLDLQQGTRITGDDFWVGREFPRYGDSMVRGIFGQGFVDALGKAPMNQWVGPVQSPRGWHYVRKSAVEAPAVIPYADIRDQVVRDMEAKATTAALDAEIARLTEIHGVKDAR